MTTPARKLLLINRKSQAPVEWLLFDDFLTDQAAPLPSPRVAEPGPGTWTLVENGPYCSGGRLYGPGGATVGIRLTSAENQMPGYALIFKGRNMHYTGLFTGWWANFAATVYSPSTIRGHDHGFFTIGMSSTTTDTLTAIVRRQGKGFYTIESGMLSWVGLPYNGNTPAGISFNDTRIGGVDYFGIRMLPPPFSEEYGLATFHEPTPSSGASYTATADGIFDLTVTAPNPLSGSAELRFRVQDANNYWTAYFNDAGSFRVDSVAGGTPTNRINIASAIAAGDTRGIRVMPRGALLDAFTGTSTTWFRHGSQVNLNYLTDQTTLVPVVTAGWTLGALDAWVRYLSPAQVAELERV